MRQVALADVLVGVQEHLRQNRIPEAVNILVPALNQYPDNAALWFFYGYACNRIGHNAMASEAWRRSFDLEPQAQVLGNLGAAIRETLRPEDARVVLRKALRMSPDDESTLANLLGSYVNEGQPEEALALVAGRPLPASKQAQFNLSLLNLEAGRFAEGFRLYAVGHHDAREIRHFEGAERLTADNYQAALGKRLIVYGEQGIGDEIMFSTMLDLVARDFEVTFDCHPRLVTLHETAPWRKNIRHLYPTRKILKPAWHRPGSADFYAPIADLAQFYRPVENAFQWRGPYFKPDASETRTDRAYLESLADGRKIVGLSMRGGSIKTARTYRVIAPNLLEPLWKRDDIMFVALDYDDISDIVFWVSEHYGPEKLAWFPSITWAWDYAHKAALVAACDAVVTVCQSVAHLSAAIEQRTHVLTPSKPAWRYGVREGSGDHWYWYPGGHAILHRQQGDDWTRAINEIEEALRG